MGFIGPHTVQKQEKEKAIQNKISDLKILYILDNIVCLFVHVSAPFCCTVMSLNLKNA